MGEVGIHDDDVVVFGEFKAGDDGGGQAAVLSADEIADLGVAEGEAVEDLRVWSGELSLTTMSSQFQPPPLREAKAAATWGMSEEGCRLP